MPGEEPFVLVVGAAGGIGGETVRLLLESGCSVLAADVDGGRLEERLSGMPGGGSVERVVLDITDREAVLSLVERLERGGVRLRAAVMVAAVHSTYPVEELPDELVERVLACNLTDHVKMVRDLIPLLEPDGRIVGVSSIAAGVGVPMSSLYSASKAGMEAFYESMQIELGGRGLRCVLVHPGNVNTGFNETGNEYPAEGASEVDRAYRRVVSTIDSRYGIAPERVARVILKGVLGRRPRFVYIVGGNARKAYWAVRLLGRNLALKLAARFFGFR